MTSNKVNLSSYRDESNPISNFKITLSKPCGNLKENYNKRKVSISKIFTEANTCSYYNDDEKSS